MLPFRARPLLSTCRAVARPVRFQNQCRRNGTSSSTPPPTTQRNVVGVFSPTSAVLFIAVGAGMYFYFTTKKQQLLEEREKERMSKSYGRPNLGGPFALLNCTATPSSNRNEIPPTFTDKDILGKWSLVYFGFTNCPDICPAELDKVTAIVNDLSKTNPSLPVQPIFISVDPARDTPPTVRKYLSDFHPSYIGLVGDYAQTKAVCKGYRVYFSTPPDADPTGDYLVDHSIFVYLMDPEGKFVDAFGQVTTKDDVVEKIQEYVKEWNR
ncbi:h-sco1 [Dendrothele bispora CBS 962.96]|uniref:H-sco1 n=1 Tax=Dendrothele bispora (strain CBS 962.96) TaxID=1314807 RepID=A0A4S8MNJ6_DENBC|nr:h-sco1 [Dendrothele bispora CBS 962.96]